MNMPSAPKRGRSAVAATIGAIVIGACIYLLASGSTRAMRDGKPHVANDMVGDMAAVDARLDRLERTQAQQLAEINRQLAKFSAHARPDAPDEEQLRREEQQREHSRRMRDDPAYERQVMEQRLAGMNQEFADEPMDHRWSVETRGFTSDALQSAVQRAQAALTMRQIDCRSTTCRIRIDVDSRSSYEDIATYLMTDLAESLPNAQYVVMPPANGVRSVTIFAHRPSAE